MMKKVFLIIFSFTVMLHAVLTEDLVLQIYSGTQAEITGMANPQLGNTVYNTDDSQIYVYDGTAWVTSASDKQDITLAALSGTSLTIGITNGNSDTVNLSALVDDADANASNEIQTLSISGQDISLSNGGGTVSIPSETSTSLSQDTSTGIITYTNEDSTTQKANVISTDVDNQIVLGTDGGAYLGPTVYSGFFIIDASGSKVITGLPFKPSQITFIAHANIESLNIDSGGALNTNTIGNSFGSMNGFARDDNGVITQQVIYVGGSGNSINNISRYASSANCIGLRYGDRNGANLGKISASLSSFNTDGFTINVTRTSNATSENLVVLYTGYK